MWCGGVDHGVGWGGQAGSVVVQMFLILFSFCFTFWLCMGVGVLFASWVFVSQICCLVVVGLFYFSMFV